jgi:hypothetical protein
LQKALHDGTRANSEVSARRWVPTAGEARDIRAIGPKNSLTVKLRPSLGNLGKALLDGRGVQG